MRTTLGFASTLAVIVAAGTGCAAQGMASADGGLIPPPAISIPYGGKVVTEINLSDNDVLGIIKQIIPAIGEVAASVMPMAAPAAKNPVEAKAMAAVGNIDFQGLADAISGITNFRVLVVKYGVVPKTPELQKQLDSGVAKLGKFSRVISDVGMIPGVLALYAQADGGGYVGYAFNPKARSLYAVRIVGSADMAKLTKWVIDTVRTAVGGMMAPAPEEPEGEPSSEQAPATELAPESH